MDLSPSLCLSVDDHCRLSFPSDGWSALPTRFGFWPENPTTAGVVSSRVFSARLP
ncbi:hypothetical protein AtEden1_Chr5g0145581 [Arabidopsis thaliana]